MASPKIDAKLLIANSAKLFCLHGYHNTSIADIAKFCGLSKASLYHHFASKRELAMMVIQYIHHTFQEKIFCWLYQKQLTDKQRLKNFFDALIKYFEEQPVGSLIGNFSLEVTEVEPELADLIQTHFTEWLNALQFVLKPRLGNKQAKIIARETVCLIQGEVLLMRFYQEKRISLTVVYERLISTLESVDHIKKVTTVDE